MMSLIKKEGRRFWKIQTPHGNLQTPIFMPDATYGVVTGLSSHDLELTNTKALVTTTLHIEQKLSSEYISKVGGLNKFIGWDSPILTDSGGFQVFSLINRQKDSKNLITDAGCSFTSPIEGKYNFLSPENSQTIQHNIGSDIRIVLDEPVIEDGSLASIKRSVQRTTLWAKRSKEMFLKLHNLTEKDFLNPDIKRPLLCAVIQGGNNFKYREISANQLVEIGFDIYGFGGIPVHNKLSWKRDAPKGFYKELVAYVASLIPEDKIRYGLGIGSPDNIKYAIKCGWDIFDCVLPTRNARHSYLYVSKGQGDVEYDSYSVLHIKSLRYKYDEKPIDEKCNCLACKEISRQYLRYLLNIKSPAGIRYATIHNLYFYNNFVNQLCPSSIYKQNSLHQKLKKK